MSYIKLFFRKFKKNKLFTLLNLFGLTIGLSAFIYMNSYVNFERSFEDFNQSAKRVYRVTSQKTQNNEIQERKSCAPVILKEHLLTTHGEIEKAVRVHIIDAKRLIIRIEDAVGNIDSYTENIGYHAEKDFFDLFGTPLIKGNPETALDGPNKVVLTKSTANKYFGDSNPIGKLITITDDFEMEYEVTGILDDVPANSHFQYNLLISFDTFVKQRPTWRWEAWDWDYFHTYLKVKEETNSEDLEGKINSSIAIAARSAYEERGYTMSFELQNIADIHLNSNLGRELSANGNGELLIYLEIIAYFILLLAWINYINLSTAITSLRAKEIGVRKTVGANKASLIFQYLAEAFFYNLFAIIASLGLVYFVNPSLSTITGFQLDYVELMNFNVGIFIIVILLIGTLGSGLYPAFILSNIKPQRVLKGKYANSKKGLLLRKSLVVFQFTMAIILMILTSGIYKQVNFMRQRELGLNIDQVLITNMPNIRSAETFWSNYDNLKNQLLAKSYVSKVTTSNEIPGSYLNQIELFKQKSQLREEAQIMKFVWVDYDFFELYDMELVQGRLFSEDNQSDVQDGVIFTEEAIKLLGYTDAKSAIDQPVDWIRNWGEIEPYKVIGVAKNYEQEANSRPQAVVFQMNRRQKRWLETNQIAIKLNNTANMQSQIDEIGQIHSSVYPNDSFDYFFQDDHYNRRYQSDMKFGKIFTFFSSLTLSITILGIFGLTAFLVIGKRKEVSIKRVLGQISTIYSVPFLKVTSGK